MAPAAIELMLRIEGAEHVFGLVERVAVEPIWRKRPEFGDGAARAGVFAAGVCQRQTSSRDDASRARFACDPGLQDTLMLEIGEDGGCPGGECLIIPP